MYLVAILSRWLHVMTACVAIGGLFFVRLVLPAGLAMIDSAAREPVLIKIRRRFKMVIHSAILLFLITGAYNVYVSRAKYHLNPPLLHSLLGIHILLALCVFAISIYLLIGPKPPKGNMGWMALNLVLLAMVVGAASTLKWAREKAIEHAAAVTAHQ